MTRPSLGRLWCVRSLDIENVSPNINIQLGIVILGAGKQNFSWFYCLQSCLSVEQLNKEHFKPCFFVVVLRLVASSTS